jgi:hypothetical protein
LHNDSAIWNWFVDLLLRFYFNEIHDEAVLTRLTFTNTLNKNPEMIEHFVKNTDWLRWIVSLYEGYKNYDTQIVILEYYEICQFLTLSDMQRAPFIFSYQEIWNRDDPAYSMVVHLDTKVPKDRWIEKSMLTRMKSTKNHFW